MSDQLQKATNAFLQSLTDTIDLHSRHRRFDAGLHQFLIIGSAVAGFASLTFGLLARDYKEYAIWAGAIGAVTSVATILSQQLHCVKAVNWHNRMAVELDIIRDQFLYKYRAAPTDLELVELSEEVANLKLRMLKAWETVAGGPAAPTKTKKPPNDSPES